MLSQFKTEISTHDILAYLSHYRVISHPIYEAELGTSLEQLRITLEFLPADLGRVLQVGAAPYFLPLVLCKFSSYEMELVDYFRCFSQDAETVFKQYFEHRETGEEFYLSYRSFDIERQSFPYDNEAFDGVIMYDLLQRLMRDPVAVLAEIYRVLTPGGWLLLTTPNAAYYENIVKLWLARNIAYPYSNQEPCDRNNRLYTLPEVQMLLQETKGLVIDKLEARAIRQDRSSDWRSRIVRLLKPARFHEEELFCLAHKEGHFYCTRPEWLYKTYAVSGPPKSEPLAESDLRLPSGPIGPSRFPRRVCKLCDEADWRGEEWLRLLEAMGVGWARERIRRKAWEWSQGLYALQHLGLLREVATAIGVGTGIEQILFYLTNHIQMVYATDIYGKGEFADKTAYVDMLTSPERYAQIPFRKDHLTVMYMDGRKLEFSDNYFDFAFSFSSIEHFGGHEAAAQAVKEMGRVIKPGGVVVITTEVILNGVAHHEFFLPEELEYLVQASGLQLIEDIDYTISSQTLKHPVDFEHPSCYTAIPHILCKSQGVYWTSVCMVMEKPIEG